MGLHRVGHDWSDLAAAAVYLECCVTITSIETQMCFWTSEPKCWGRCGPLCWKDCRCCLQDTRHPSYPLTWGLWAHRLNFTIGFMWEKTVAGHLSQFSEPSWPCPFTCQRLQWEALCLLRIAVYGGLDNSSVHTKTNKRWPTRVGYKATNGLGRVTWK